MDGITNCAGTEPPFVSFLECFSRADLLSAGGKAANLGELIRAGFPVPPGFVITTAAYDRFVSLNGLIDTITSALMDEKGGGLALRSAFEAAPIPPEVEREILAAYRQIGPDPVAVRSSATAEDLPQAAFAGQQDTFLNIINSEALLAAVRRCWASLWTDRAIAYRRRMEVESQTVKLAVVVQRMVPAEYAGVLFTANPVTGARDEFVVDASPGLGEAVVSGLVTPEHMVLDSRSGRVKERRPGRQEVIVQARPGGGTEQVAGMPTVHISPLPAGALRRLARMGAAIERHFANPQDIEWAWSAGKLFILQARPITALPDPTPHASKPVQMLSALFAEMFPIRPYPLDQTTWIHALSEGAIEPLFSLLGLAIPSIDQQFIEEDGVVIRFRGQIAVRPTPGILLAPARFLILAIRYAPAQWHHDPKLSQARQAARALEARDLQALSWEELLQTIHEALSLPRSLAGMPRRRYLPRTLLAAGLLRLLLALLGRGDRFAALLSGVKSTTVAANDTLASLAARVRADPVLAAIFSNTEPGDLLPALEVLPAARSFLDDLRDFMDCYGHREIVLSTVLLPTWKEAPDVVLGIIQGFARQGPRAGAEHPAWETAFQELRQHPLLRFKPFRSAFLRLVTTARSLWQIREDSHFDATRILPVLRRTFLELGRRLSVAGVLVAPEDIFHLQLGDLDRVSGTWPPSPELASGLRASVERRKQRRASLEGTPVVDPRLYRLLAPAGEALLRGTPGSPGVAEGPVRVILAAYEFGKLRSGEVLVAPYTNPAWTPLFQTAAAVVVDGGAAGSHAAIVAREYGLPAVMGTVVGTQQLHDGQWVQVDGSRGLVLPARPP